MFSTRHLTIALILSSLTVIFGTLGYMLIEGWNFLDALFMVTITLTTVGYSEVNPLTATGRIFTIALIYIGFGFFVYAASAIVQLIVEGQIYKVVGRKRLDRKIERLKNHYIVCGYGKIGGVLCKKLRTKPLELVVIENNKELIPALDDERYFYIIGDATDEAVLLQAGIKRAKGLVAVLATDADNVFLVLTARQLNPDLNITARAMGEASKSKLKAAGANRVESPYDMGAASMAQRILRPTVTNFLDLAFADNPKDIQMEEIPVSAESHLVNVQLKDSGIRQKYSLIIIAIKKPDGNMQFNPSFETTIQIGDTVIAVGEAMNLQKLELILNPAKAST